MTRIYIETDKESWKILNVSTICQGSTYEEVYLEDPIVDLSRLSGYTFKDVEGKRYIIFDEDKYEEFVAQEKKEQAISEGEELMKQLTADNILAKASDEQAYIMRYLYYPWEPNKSYVTGDRKLYGDNLYKCKQNHTSEDGPNRTPDYLPALWDLIAPDDPTIGTKDNPIIIPEPFSSMEYVKGKYYKEGDVLYLMNREGMADGEKVSLTYKPSQLVDHYFEIVSES